MRMSLAALQDAKCLKGDDEIAPVLQLHGSGTTNPSKLLWKVMDELTVRVRVLRQRRSARARLEPKPWQHIWMRHNRLPPNRG